MDDTSNHQNQKVLLLCDCVPSPVGTTRQTRAWQLIRQATSSYGVHLICTPDQPTNLSHWRTAQAQVEYMAIETTPLRYRVLQWVYRPFSRPAANRVRRRALLTDTTQTAVLDSAYDTIVCTHPELWGQAKYIPAALRVCDDTHAISAPHQDKNKLSLAADHQVGAHWDIRLTDTTTPEATPSACPAQTIQVPHAVDTDYLAAALWNPDVNRGSHAKRSIVLHADWDRPASRAYKRWFTRVIWPVVQKQNDHVTLTTTTAADTKDPVATLCAATLVVHCTAESGRHAQNALLQAMATQRPIITASSAAGELGADHGVHVMKAESVDDQVITIRRALLDTHLQLHLSQAAAALAQRHSIYDCGSDQLAVLFSRDHTPRRPLAQAA